MRAAAPSALYQRGRGCGACFRFTSSANKSVVAHVTDMCVDCIDTQFLLSDSAFLKLGESVASPFSMDYEPVACPPPAKVVWHQDSQKYWARFLIAVYPEVVREVRVRTSVWETLAPSPWGEYTVPQVDQLVMETFLMEIRGQSNKTYEYIVDFPYMANKPAKSNQTNYPGPEFPLMAV